MSARMSKKKLRPMGEITADLEILLEEMTDPEGQDLQWGEILFLIFSWLSVHAQHARETYTEDGSHPEFKYGPR